MSIPDLRRALADALGLEQYEVEGLLARLTPTIVVSDISPAGEQTVGPRWAMGQSDKAAVAGEYGISHLQNPAGSGVFVEVHDLWLTCAPSSISWLIGWSNTEEAAASPTSWINRYLGTVAIPGRPTCRLTEGSDPASGVAAGNVLWYQDTTSSRLHRVPLGGRIVLRPGTGLRAVSGTVNEPIKASWLWREVPEK